MEAAKILSPEDRTSAVNIHMYEGDFISQDAKVFSRMEAKSKLGWLVGDYEAGDVFFSYTLDDPRGAIERG